MSHIIGTAGHIDHGKTALVRALTGQDTDRLQEEKERGISIDLGFAHFDLANGERVGIVDVPGHERFIRNMLAGAHGIDLALLVVAADDGVMPQTEEHLDILHLLGASQGIVAITKIDLVDPARIAAVEEEIEILLAGTGLEGSPTVPVSSLTGAGVDTLRSLIEARLTSYQRRTASGFFRMPIDRAFVMHGHGTVVTGTAVAGSIRPGDNVRLLPGGEVVRVRSAQVHGVEVGRADFGQRVALNLAGIERADVARGHVVCDPSLDRVSDRFDAWVEIRPAARRPVASHDAIRVYLGTAEVLGKIIILGGERALAPRQAGYAQLVLREPVHALRGDRFILRNASAQRTVGGGIVVHPFAPRHRSREAGLVARLDSLRNATDDATLLRGLVASAPEFAVDVDSLVQASALPATTVHAALRGDAALLPLPDAKAVAAYATVAQWDILRDRVVATLGAFHAASPLLPGMEMESLHSQLLPDVSPKLFRAVVEALLANKVVARKESLLHLPSHRVALKQDEEAVARRAEELLAAAGVTPPDLKQLETELGVNASRLRALLQQLEREGRVARIADGMYFAPAAIEQARSLLRTHATEHGEITAATFRDLLGASRKFSIALLDYFDRTGFTLRVGDIRKLRK